MARLLLVRKNCDVVEVFQVILHLNFLLQLGEVARLLDLVVLLVELVLHVVVLGRLKHQMSIIDAAAIAYVAGDERLSLKQARFEGFVGPHGARVELFIDNFIFELDLVLEVLQVILDLILLTRSYTALFRCLLPGLA